MDKEQAKKYLPLVNSPEFPVFLDLLKDRVQFHQDRLEKANTLEGMFKYQGALAELRYLEKIRETVLALRNQNG